MKLERNSNTGCNKTVVRLEVNGGAAVAILGIAFCTTVFHLWRYTWNRIANNGISDEEICKQMAYESINE